MRSAVLHVKTNAQGFSSFVLVKIGILHRRRTLLRNDSLKLPLRLRLLHRRASEEKHPVVPVVEMKKHFAPRAKDLGDHRLLHPPLPIALPHIRKERVSLLAAVGILQIVAKLERMVEVKIQSPDEEFRQFVKRVLPAKHDLRLEIFALQGEVVFGHEAEGFRFVSQEIG